MIFVHIGAKMSEIYAGISGSGVKVEKNPLVSSNTCIDVSLASITLL